MLEHSQIMEASGPRLPTMICEYRGWVHRCLLKAGVPQCDVGDVAQEVWIVVAEKVATFEPLGAGSVTRWLGWICQFKVMEYRAEVAGRREEPARLDDDDDDEQSPEWLTDAAPSAEDRIFEHSRIALLRAAVAELRTEAPKLYSVMAAELAGVPMPHAAMNLRIPLGTAYTRLRRGREVVQAQLRRWEDDTRAAVRMWLDAMRREPCM